MVSRLFLKSTIVICLLLLVFYPVIQRFNFIENRIFQTCQFVYDHVVPVRKDLKAWLMNCRVVSRPYSSPEQETNKQLEMANQILSQLNLSHLELFNEQENEAIWTDTDKENGIESKFVDGELIVTRVILNSEAHKKGIRRGDIITTDASLGTNPYSVNHWAGKLEFERKKKRFIVDLIPQVLNTRRDISISDYGSVKVISVGSFKSQYFDSDTLRSVFSKISSSDHLILDFRGNNGGNFVAGLRFLSPFLCQERTVGYMRKRKNLGRVGYFKDQLDDEYQIQVLSRFDSVALRTFPSSHCLPKPKLVIVDAFSKSTAEWVALAFKETLGTPLNGATTAGELLVGVWYDVSHIWGRVVKLSVPAAFYESINGSQIEGHGIPVDTTIYPRRADYEQGYDSEIWQAVQRLKNGDGS